VFHHVTRNIETDKIGPCVDFYGLLGFTRIPPPSAVDPRATWLQSADGTQIHLIADDEAGPEQGHFALIDPRYQESLARLKAQGHTPEPRREHFGSPRCYVHDPAGNLVELMAEPS
jgi:catechol 2,3-dioxygenase-like lactoylglutathione lyase family enzyme